MAAFDAELQMWSLTERSDPEEALAREFEAHQAAHVAQAVQEEVDALTWEVSTPPAEDATTDWVAESARLIDAISGRLVQHPGVAPTHPRKRPLWHEEGADVMSAPWGYLLSTALPLGASWHPADMLRLRCVCGSLRDDRSTAQYFADILATLGIRGIRPHCHSPRRLFTLACRVFSELSFVHSIRTVAARAAGMRADAPAADNLCCVAGSYALNRFLLLGEGTDVDAAVAADNGVDWTPGDIDVFVNCVGAPSSPTSAAIFQAIVAHARAVCPQIYRDASIPVPAFGLGTDVDRIQLDIRPSVTLSHEYPVASSALPSQIEAAMATQGSTYPREQLIEMIGAPDWVAGITGVPWAQPPPLSVLRSLPATLGLERPVRVERVAEILPFGAAGRISHYARAVRASISHGRRWPMPMKLNIIQLSTSNGLPLPPSKLIAGFDMVPAQVVMRVDHRLRPSFQMEANTKACIHRRELRLSRFAFGPARDRDRLAVEASITKQLCRCAKYLKYGFNWHTDAAAA